MLARKINTKAPSEVSSVGDSAALPPVACGMAWLAEWGKQMGGGTLMEVLPRPWCRRPICSPFHTIRAPFRKTDDRRSKRNLLLNGHLIFHTIFYHNVLPFELPKYQNQDGDISKI